MIGIIDYGMGNLFSVNNALKRLGAETVISGDPEVLASCEGLVLPGVGAFPDAMAALREQKLDLFLKEYVTSGKPLLGICLGMQLLFESSDEHGYSTGLGFLKGHIVKFAGIDREGRSYKVPHMGWNKLHFHQEHPLLAGLEEDYVYFVHSYYAEIKKTSELLASASYDVEVPGIVGLGNVMGMQFHPEKSGQMGKALLQNYIKLVEEKERLVQ
ncbi:imidazole glycerol phosphate synthase subunit HisH [Pradoshia sp.]|uniref:imidazole glycerol phosphate synthase subunit HisH n=1 Tax=Pradoshia sp. TaxID=2651281 RepID=UPI003F0575CC